MGFDIDAFKASVFEGQNAEKYVVFPEGEHVGTIEYAEPNGGDDKNGRPWANLKLRIKSINPSTGEEQVANGTMGLNLTDSGGLDFGINKNVTLGQLRSACGCNQPGKAFQWSDLLGNSVRFLVKHRPDKNDAEKVYEEFVGFKKQ
jgi:hypothetical protein